MASRGRASSSSQATEGTKLLSGGNPQIPKVDGDGPVQAYLDAMPGWKGDVTFLNGSSLRPLPPVASKDEAVHYLHVHEDDEIDEELVTSWIRQASKLPGDALFR